MSELFDFSKTIQTFIKDTKYEDALSYYKNNHKKFNQDEIAKNEYIVSDIIKCLRKVKKPKGAKKYLGNLGINLTANSPKRILESYGWALYDQLKLDSNTVIHDTADLDVITIVKDEQYNKEDIFGENDPLQEEIKTIIPMLDYDSKYSPFTRLFNATLKKEKIKPRPNWLFINNLLDQIIVDKLNTNCETFEAEIKGRKKTIEMASDKETWYAFKTKALLKLGLFQDCYDFSQKALEIFVNFHYNNNIWFARRIALCKKELGDVDAAIKELLIILKKKKEWFIQAELCDLYLNKSNFPEALKYGVLAAINYGDIEYKISLFLQMGKLFEIMGDNNRAYEHYLLVKLVREEQGWKITKSLTDLLIKTKEKYEIDFNDSHTLFQHLLKQWRTFLQEENKDETQIKSKDLRGEISNIRTDKKFGFIRGIDNHDYHFFIDQLRGDSNKYAKGVKVIYDAKPPKSDGKKPSAINIRLKY